MECWNGFAVGVSKNWPDKKQLTLTVEVRQSSHGLFELAWRTVKILMALFLLTACGGGGGGGSSTSGGSNSSAAVTPSLLVPSAPVVVTTALNALVDQATGWSSTTSVPVTLVNVSSTAVPYGQYSTSGIAQVNWQWVSSTEAKLLILFKPPYSLVPGSYSDNIYLKMCMDSSCSQVVAGTELTVPVTYTITAPASGSVPSVTLSTANISAQALASDYTGLGFQTVNLTLSNFGYKPKVQVTTTNNAVQFVNTNVPSNTQASLDISLKQPSSLSAGTYSDTILVTVCLDQACVNPVAGSPFSIAVTYVIGDTITVTGPNGYTLRAVNTASRGVAWDGTRGRIYVLQESSGRGQILALDPDTGATVGGVLLNSYPSSPTGALAISANDQYLYVGLNDGSVQRLALPALTPDLNISLGMDGNNNRLYAAAIAVAPAAPETFAVAISSYPAVMGGFERGVVVYDGNVMRANGAVGPSTALSPAPVDYLVWSPDQTKLYGSNYSFNGNQKVYALNVNGTGITGTAVSSGSISGGRLRLNGDRLYTDTGNIVDASSLSIIQSFKPFGSTIGLIPDAAVNKLFVMGASSIALSPTINSYSLDQQVFVASLVLPRNINSIGELFRLGNNRLVYRTDNTLVLIRGAFASQ
ncbi:MAG: hypothetical protein QM808_06500 [Steroidobacteraceae bacterium]